MRRAFDIVSAAGLLLGAPGLAAGIFALVVFAMAAAYAQMGF